MYLRKIYTDSIRIDSSYSRLINNKDMTIVSISDTAFMKIGRVEMMIDNYLERVDQVQILNEQDTISTINFSYQNIDGFWLPDSTIFNFNLKKRLPKASGPSITNPFGSIDIGSAEDHFQSNGKVTMIFNNFKVNTGISDDFFADKSEK